MAEETLEINTIIVSFFGSGHSRNLVHNTIFGRQQKFESNQESSIIPGLPNPVSATILQFVDINSLPQCLSVCKRWYITIEEKIIKNIKIKPLLAYDVFWEGQRRVIAFDIAEITDASQAAFQRGRRDYLFTFILDRFNQIYRGIDEIIWVVDDSESSPKCDFTTLETFMDAVSISIFDLKGSRERTVHGLLHFKGEKNLVSIFRDLKLRTMLRTWVEKEAEGDGTIQFSQLVDEMDKEITEMHNKSI